MWKKLVNSKDLHEKKNDQNYSFCRSVDVCQKAAAAVKQV